MLIHVLVLNCVAMIISISITTIISSVEKHGIHRQKDLNKFYSNLLKNNISMGAYNVKANTDTTSEGREDSTTTDQARDNDRDSVKEKKTLNDDDGIIVEQKRKDLKRLHEEEDLEERTVNETAERSKEVQNKVEPSAQDNHDAKEEKQENTKKKHAEKRNNDETVMAARERYLARKRMKQEAQQ